MRHRAPPLMLLVALAACQCDDRALNPLSPAIEARPSLLAFGDVYLGFDARLEVRLSNVGGAPLEIFAVVVEGAGFDIDDTAPSVLPPGGERLITVAFVPSTLGAAASALVVSSDASNSPVTSIPLTGNGLTPPECEDLGPCTVGVFDPATSACGFEILEGACDDGSGCTAGDTCVEGRCVGAAIDCGEPPAECMVGLCGAGEGCLFLPVDEACDDGDPCTADECGASGCASTVVDDGTPCGAASCSALLVCLSGACEELATPDGFPCSDGDVCTSGDVCADGACGGQSVTSDGDVLGEAHTFGAQGAVGVVIDDGRVVVIDGHPYLRGALFTVLERSGGAVEISSQRFEPSYTERSNSLAPTPGGFGVLGDDGDLVVYALNGADVERRGAIDLWTEPAAYLKPALVSLGDNVLAACRPGSSELFVVSVADAAAPTVEATKTLPAGCEHLAWDDKRGLLLATLDDLTMVRTNPAAPDPFGVVDSLPGPHRLVASAGDLLALGVVANDFASTVAEVALYHADTLELVATVSPALGGGIVSGVEAVALTERLLFVLTSGPLTAFDLASVASPAPITISDDDGGVHNSSGARVFSTDGATLVRSYSTGYWDRFHLLDITGEPVELSHPRRGSTTQFARSGGALYALHKSSVRLLDDGAPGSPAIVEGSDLMSRRDALWGLGAGGGVPLFVVSYGLASMVGGSQPLSWLDGQHPASASVVGDANLPFLSGVSSVVSDGRYAYGLRITYADEPFFDVYDLADMVPDADSGPPIALASLPLALDGAAVNNWLRVATSGARVVGVMQHDWGFGTPAVELRSELLVVDVPAPAAPALTASASLEGLVRHGRAHGDVILAVRRTSGGWYNTEHEGEEVLRLIVDGDRVDVDAALLLEESGGVLWLDDARAVVSTKDGVAFLDHAPGSLSLRGALSLADPPADAAVVGEALWLVGEHGVTAVQLPCP